MSYFLSNFVTNMQGRLFSDACVFKNLPKNTLCFVDLGKFRVYFKEESNSISVSVHSSYLF